MKKSVDQVIQRIPPQNIEVEQAILGTILITGKIPSNLLSEWFYKDHHRIIFSAMLALSAGGKIDPITLTNYLRDKNKLEQVGGGVYIANLASLIPSISKIDEYARIIREKAVLRKIIGASHEVMQISYEEQGDVPEILASWQRQLYEIQASFGVLDDEKMDMGFDDLLAGFVAKETHLQCLNNAIGGLPSDVIVVGGATSMGKTSLNLGFLYHLAIKNKERVAYFGPNVRKEEIYLRLLCAMSGISNKSIRRGDIPSKERQKLMKFHAEINSAPISIFTMPEKMSVMDIVSKTRALVEKGDIGAIMIENLQQLFWPESISKRKDELDLIFACLKALAIDLSIPVIISSQINRDVSLREDKRPKPTDLLGTSDIESLARLIILLYWDGYYYPQKNLKDKKGFEPAEIHVYKTGPPTILEARINPLSFQWKDMEK